MEWQSAVALVLGLLGIATTIFYATRRPSRRLAWEVVRDEAIRAAGVGPEGYQFSGTPKRVAIRVMNKGREPIQRQDYDEPVTFICRSHAVSAWIGERSDRTINPVAVLRDDRLSYQPFLLNPREWFELEGTIDDGMGGGQLYFHVYEGRIAGIGEIEDWAKRSARMDSVQRLVVLAAGFFLIVAAILLFTTMGLTGSALVAGIAGSVLLFVGTFVLLLALEVIRPGRLRNPLKSHRAP